MPALRNLPIARFLAANRPIVISLAVGAGIVAATLVSGILRSAPESQSVAGQASVATPAPGSRPGADAQEHPPGAVIGPESRKAPGSFSSPHRTGRLDWADLTGAEQQALAPLSAEWEKIEPLRRRKWVEIADRFPEWTPEEQTRRQDRMRELARLTPEQRRIARDTFAHAQALPPEKRAELFKQYQDLPEERKAQLAAEARATRSVVPAKPLSPHRPPVPSKAQIREGSEQKVPGLPRVAKPEPPQQSPTAGPGTSDAVLPGAVGSTPAPPASASPPAPNPANQTNQTTPTNQTPVAPIPAPASAASPP